MRVVPAVVGDFVAFVDDAFGDVWILGDQFSNNEEGGLDVALFEHVEEAGGEFGMRAVIEGHGNDGALDIATGVGVLSRGGRRGGFVGHFSAGRHCPGQTTRIASHKQSKETKASEGGSIHNVSPR